MGTPGGVLPRHDPVTMALVHPGHSGRAPSDVHHVCNALPTQVTSMICFLPIEFTGMASVTHTAHPDDVTSGKLHCDMDVTQQCPLFGIVMHNGGVLPVGGESLLECG